VFSLALGSRAEHFKFYIAKDYSTIRKCKRYLNRWALPAGDKKSIRH
jgi:hypothetical protein